MESAGVDKKTQLVERRREQILAAAKKIFARKGFMGTQVDDIADELKIGKGTIYNYFEDKRSLFLAVYEHGMAQLRQRVYANVDPIADPPLKIKTAVRTFFEFFEDDRELIEIQMQVRSDFKDDYRRIFLSMYGDYIVRIKENLRNGVRMGIFRDMDVENTADVMSAVLQGVLQEFYLREFDAAGPGAGKLTDKIEPVTRMILEGLLKR